MVVYKLCWQDFVSFYHLPPSVDIFYLVNIDKKWTFLEPPPPSSCKRSLWRGPNTRPILLISKVGNFKTNDWDPILSNWHPLECWSTPVWMMHRLVVYSLFAIILSATIYVQFHATFCLKKMWKFWLCNIVCVWAFSLSLSDVLQIYQTEYYRKRMSTKICRYVKSQFEKDLNLQIHIYLRISFKTQIWF